MATIRELNPAKPTGQTSASFREAGRQYATLIPLLNDTDKPRVKARESSVRRDVAAVMAAKGYRRDGRRR